MDSEIYNLIAITMYLLVKTEAKLNCLTDSISELSKNIISIKVK